MRVERLAGDNARTQGAERRAWYRRRSPDHPRAVAALLDDALALRRAGLPASAVVLGAGACTELPLERLAHACERVLLVDLDDSGMARARAELPAGLRGHVELIRADISGGVSERLAEGLSQQPWRDLAAMSERAILDAAAGCIERCPVPDPPAVAGLGDRACDLVVSALVLTQLFSLPLLDVLDTLADVAPLLVGRQDADPRYQAAANGFRRRVALAHLDLLAQLVAPGGVGLVVTDATGYLLPPTRGARSTGAREELLLLPPDLLDLQMELAARFELPLPPHRWEWLATEPTAAAPGRAYEVVGVALRARDGVA